eukprot:5335307-Ditylum_brightwellii.AAC.1
MARGVALKGRTGRRKKRGVGPGQGGKQERNQTARARRWIHPDMAEYKQEIQLQLPSQSLTIHCECAI